MEEVKVEVPAKFKDIVAGVEKLTLIELHELVKMLEAKWGVSAAAAVTEFLLLSQIESMSILSLLVPNSITKLPTLEPGKGVNVFIYGAKVVVKVIVPKLVAVPVLT